MSRLRWTTYDDRGQSWRQARARGVSAALALCVLGLGAVTTTATTSRAEEVAAPTADVQVLAQRQAAEERAVLSAFASRRAVLEREDVARRDALTTALAADLAAVRERARTATEQRAAEAERARAAVTTDRATAEQRLRERGEQDRRSLDQFFAEVLAGLGPETSTPTRTALETAKKSLEARRSAELTALSTAHEAEAAALKARVEAAVAALVDEGKRVDQAHAALEDALSAALSTTKATLAAELTALVRQIDAETTAVKARHAQERLDLDRVHATQRAAVAAQSSAVRQATEDRQDREEAQLKAAQANELAAQAHAKRAAQLDEEVARKAAEEQRSADDRAADAAHALAKGEVQAQESAVAAAGSAARSALADEHGARWSRVKATYDAAVSSVGDGRAGVRAAWERRLQEHEAEQVGAGKALDRATDVQRKDVEDASTGRERAAARALARAEDAREREHRKDLQLAAWTAKKELGRAERDRDRQLRLVRSEYFTLKVRAVAFGESPTSFSSVGAAFDPATDPGSLHNVADRIGALDLPDHVTGEGVDVALLDTGVVDVPGLAEAEVEIGPDFSFEDVVPELRGRDTMGHGTHLAGIIGARDEAWLAGDHERRPERVLGIAPGAGLVSVKAGAADGSVDVTQIIAAINWIIANKDTDGRNIRVLNLSFGTDGVQDPRVDPLAHAVERAWRAGIVVVVAGGNDGWAADRLTNPAQDPLVLAVGSSQALDGKEDVPSTYSNGSAVGRTVDLSAPGRSIASLRSPGSRSDEANGTGRVGERLVRGSGTSQSAAVVSGAVALLLQARPELTPDQVKHVLMATAEQADGDDAGLAGAGYLRIDEAVEAKAPWVRQQHEPSTGTGSLDGARGSVRVVRDGIVLEGEYDVFGRDWSGAKWTEDSWSGAKWTGAKWTGAKWTGTTWTGAKWTSNAWEASVWDGAKWTSQFWTGAKWTGAKWTSDGFTGAKWTGAKWTSGGWFGHGWGDGPASTSTTGAEPVSAQAEQIAATTP